jgi:uncharacterized membrane protein
VERATLRVLNSPRRAHRCAVLRRQTERKAVLPILVIRTGIAATAFFALIAAGPARDLPALHHVTGVAADDVLNVRAAPDPESDILGTLAPGASGIEVVATAGNWAQINTGERAGWASLAFLDAQQGGAFPEVPSFSCFGTEPFWSIDVTQSGPAKFDDPERPDPPAMLAGAVMPASGMRNRYGLVAVWPQGRMTLAIRAEQCSDGMSDRLYGLSVGIVATGALQRVLSGCCTIAPR